MWASEQFKQPLWPWEMPEDPDERAWWQNRLVEYVRAESDPQVKKHRERKRRKKGASAKERGKAKGISPVDGGRD